MRPVRPARFADGVPSWFGKSLFDGDLERLIPHIEGAQRRVPALANCGIKDIVNGPISYTPDGSALIGPAWGLPNVWLNEGHSFGITAAGGAGWQLAEWIVEGEPGIDLLAVDPRRFGPYAGKRYVVTKNEETYRNVFTIHYPDEERPDARPAKTSPVYDRLKHMGAVFGQRYGWERANWFAPTGVEAKDDWSFRRTNWFEHVGNECRRLRERVGVIDLTPFTKHVVEGPGAEAWLDRLVANKVPTKTGRMALSHALTKRGGIRSEFTITKLDEERFYLVSAGAAERYDTDLLHKRLPADGSVRLANITTSRGCFVLAGPRSREVLAKLTDTALDNDSFPWLTGRVAEVGLAPDVYLLRVNFVGSLGWELHFPIEYARHLFVAIFTAGAGARHRHGRHARDGVAAHGEVLSHVGQRPDAREHAARGEPRPLRADEARATSRAGPRSSGSSRPACRTASSRSRCTASPTRTRSATSRCSTARAA